MKEVYGKRNSLIALDGIDQSSKQTQVELLAEKFIQNDYQVKTLTFPDYKTKLGKLIDNMLHDHWDPDVFIRHILFELNRYESKPVLDWAKKDTIVITDRYYMSGWAYAKAAGMSRLGMNIIKSIDSLLPQPEFTFILNIKLATSVKRKQKNRDKFERDMELQRNVIKEFKELSKIWGWNIINAEREPEDIHKSICRKLSQRFPELK